MACGVMVVLTQRLMAHGRWLISPIPPENRLHILASTPCNGPDAVPSSREVSPLGAGCGESFVQPSTGSPTCSPPVHREYPVPLARKLVRSSQPPQLLVPGLPPNLVSPSRPVSGQEFLHDAQRLPS